MHGLDEINQANEAAMAESPINVPNCEVERVLRTVSEVVIERVSIERDPNVRNKLALGYFVGAFTALTAVGSPATAGFANKSLRRINAHGFHAVISMINEITRARGAEDAIAAGEETNKRVREQRLADKLVEVRRAAAAPLKGADIAERVGPGARAAIWPPKGADLSGVKPADRHVGKMRELAMQCGGAGSRLAGADKADMVKEALGLNVYDLAARHHGYVVDDGGILILTFSNAADQNAAFRDIEATVAAFRDIEATVAA